MQPTRRYEFPEELQPELERARRLEWMTLVYMASVVGVIYLTMGNSQAMKMAWIEDVLGLIPPIGFLIADRVRHRTPNRRFPYGYHRSVNIAFLVSAIALASVGCMMLIDSSATLVKQEHPTIGAVVLWGEPVWSGWLMLPALLWATIPAFFLGRAKIRVAERIHDKPLHSDAEMGRADWMTGTAAGVGVLGIAWGWWWVDAVAALLISLSVLHDGYTNLRDVVGDLMDRAPKSVDHTRYLDLPDRLRDRLQSLEWVRHAAVRVREHGHVMFAEAYLVPEDDRELLERTRQAIAVALEVDWRLHDVVIQMQAEPYETGPA